MNTYTKYGDEWMVRMSGEAVSGQTVTVSKKSGESKTETLGNMVKRVDATATIWTIRKAQATHRAHERGVCAACEYNQDAGDMQGCPKHRGNPRI